MADSEITGVVIDHPFVAAGPVTSAPRHRVASCVVCTVDVLMEGVLSGRNVKLL